MAKTTVDVTEFFQPECFVPKLKARSKDGVLKELTASLVKSERVRDGDLLLEMLRQREGLGSTGIGKGVAIPHGRSLAVNDMVVLFARAAKGVSFDAIDGEPVHLFFLIVAPPHDRANRYLPFLGKLVEILKQDENRERLLAADSFEEVADILRSAS
jgi:fructose-specific phosphotransferase system IIA component